MAGLEPVIHAFHFGQGVGAGRKAGHGD